MKEKFENYRKKGYQVCDIFVKLGVSDKKQKQQILNEVYPKAKHPLFNLIKLCNFHQVKK